METLYFVMGMLSVVVLLAVGGMVMMVRKTGNLEKEVTNLQDLLREEVRDILNTAARSEHEFGTQLDKLEALLDKKEDELIDYADKLYKNHEDSIQDLTFNLKTSVNELYRYVDSRTDKMADGFSKHIADINRQIMSGEQWALYNEGPTKD